MAKKPNLKTLKDLDEDFCIREETENFKEGLRSAAKAWKTELLAGRFDSIHDDVGFTIPLSAQRRAVLAMWITYFFDLEK